MTWYEWVWAIVAAILFFAFLMIAVVSSMINAQTGSVGGSLIILLVGPPLAALASVTWPMWFPFTLILDIRNDMRNKNK